MGGCCCCCSSKETVLSAPPAYYYYPRAPEEHVPLSSHQGAASSFSGRLLVDTNLDTSSPDTYRPPPAPIPFNVTFGTTQTPPAAQEIRSDKHNAPLLSTDSSAIQEPVSGDNHGTPVKMEELKESECKVQADLEIDSAKGSEIELAKPGKPVILVEEEDTCPICLEEYDAENPKLATNCDHHFHLACILEWMERSETCPVCDQVSPNNSQSLFYLHIISNMS
ncbi:probable E3 ubiquitin-protein ligase RHB1A isoform X2 [Vigna umbellata]|uniref:probable E3 ubiquitin-protein ligase RHB1A isoform X2 n=1 Tax=Vigna umbellata TaxID=87088 RepID=UPI001F5F895F|nr:probable E3 ubiquitin-protein ligase RHB1A isoform X2 [Vigna umbellata]XP_052723743.1 probable E3 ubiquitin-protein ligase RHB1A isoform X1 [Vigna angularis]XP_052723748.1 probable E3 ubiquitin-protein ligase RHB1A isoform X1 [Vigna angularis]